MQQPAAKLAQRSLFKQPLADANTNGNTHGQTNGQTNGHANGGTHEGTNGITNGDAEGVALGNEEGDTRGESGRSSEETLKKRTFIDDESEYRLAFSRADDGKAQMKLTQVRIHLSFWTSTYGTFEIS